MLAENVPCAGWKRRRGRPGSSRQLSVCADHLAEEGVARPSGAGRTHFCARMINAMTTIRVSAAAPRRSRWHSWSHVKHPRKAGLERGELQPIRSIRSQAIPAQIPRAIPSMRVAGTTYVMPASSFAQGGGSPVPLHRSGGLRGPPRSASRQQRHNASTRGDPFSCGAGLRRRAELTYGH